MSVESDAKSPAERVSAFRARQRAKGLKLVQLWVPDPDTVEFKTEARRQSAAIAASPIAADDQAFINSITQPWWEKE